jgi:hypothetical protein
MTGRSMVTGRLRLAALTVLAAPAMLATACTGTGQPVDSSPTGSPTPHTVPTPWAIPEPTVPPEDPYLDLEFDYDVHRHECLPPETFDTLRRVDPDADYEILQEDFSENDQRQILACVYMRAGLADLTDGAFHSSHVFITTVIWLHHEQPTRFGSGTATAIPLASHDLLDWFDNAWSAREYDDWRGTCHRHRLGSCDTIEDLPVHGPGWLLLFNGHVGNLRVTANITYAGADLPDREQANEIMTGIYRDIVLAEIERRPHQERP